MLLQRAGHPYFYINFCLFNIISEHTIHVHITQSCTSTLVNITKHVVQMFF